MNKYNKWMKVTNATEEVIYELCDKEDVLVNGQLYESVINDANEWQKFVDIFWLVQKNIYTPYIGDMFNCRGDNYIVSFVPEERETYWSCKARLCNTSFQVKSDGKIIYDERGNMIGKTDAVIVDIPCVAEKSLVYGEADLDGAINLPDNKVKISFSYTDVNFTDFKMYGNDFKVRDVDYTQSYNGKGLVTISAERVIKS